MNFKLFKVNVFLMGVECCVVLMIKVKEKVIKMCTILEQRLLSKLRIDVKSHISAAPLSVSDSK